MADEEGNKPEDANQIFGTYINKDSSEKPDGVKKMLKVSRLELKPLLINFFVRRDLNPGLQDNTSQIATSLSTIYIQATL